MKTSTTLSSLLLPTLLSAGALAQSPVPVLRLGEEVPGMGTTTDARRPRVNNHGDWLALVQTDSTDHERNELMMRSGAIHLAEGDRAPGLPRGYVVRGFQDYDLNDGGDHAECLRLEDPSGLDVRALYLNSVPLLVSGDAVTAAGFDAGTTFVGFYSVHLNDSGHILLGCKVLESGVYTDAVLLLALDGSGGIASQNLWVRVGDTPNGQTEEIVSFYGDHRVAALNDSGNRLWTAILDLPAASGRDVLYQDQASLLAQTGQASIVSGRDWSDSLSMMRCDLNNSNSAVFLGTLDSTDTGSDELIVLDGSVFLREGGAFPLFTGATVESVGYEAWLADTGDVLYYCGWSDATSTSAGVFLGSKVIARAGLSQTLGGELVTAIRGWDMAVSDDGDFVMYRGSLAGGQEALLLTERNIGTTFCSAEPNSTGSPSAIVAKGSTDVSLNSFQLYTYNLPSNQFAYSILSMTQGNLLHPGGSQGRLCLGGKIARLTSGAGTSSAGGGLVVDVDLSAIPMAPPVAIQAGETWNAQTWHRDLNPGATSNFSRPLSITFR